MKRATLASSLLLVVVTTCGALGASVPATASAAAPVSCGMVNDSHGEARAAINNIKATNITCAKARTVALEFLERKLPSVWHVKTGVVLVFTRGSARVTGEEAN
jgi:hypothetical protein